MRKHLFHCFVKQTLTPFPSKERFVTPKRALQDIYCYCRMPELKEVPMIECTNCFKWYHNACCYDIPDECLDTSVIACST